MNWKKGIVALPLSVSLLLPTAGIVSAQNGETHSAPTVETPAADLRATLGHLLSEHAYFAIETMRKGAEGAADFEESAGALSDNTEDLAKAISSVYGEEAGKQFHDMWSNHIGFFVDYVKATGNKDEDAKQKALDSLANYKNEFSQFLETATGERLEADALAEGLQMHVNQLIGAFDSYVAGNYEKAYEYEREAINHMHMVAKGLSSAITDQFPDKFNNTMAVTPASDLRAKLGHLLAEHAGLAMMAMQNGIDGSKDFEASAQALSENTDDLAAAISSVYGEDAGMKFKEMWSGHIGYFVDYVKATAANDEAKKEEALKNLEQYREDFSNFLETATDERLKADMLSQGLQDHVEQLIGAFNSYAGENYATAYDNVREAYAHMFTPAKALSGAFVNQFPEKFESSMPSDMPKTGMGGTAQQQEFPFELLLAGLLAIAAATGVVLRRKQIER
ncbi:copper amine oxidase [Pseudalkalibacillus caeni]|uniref:Copper amine oxidase n=1 Tax=Exobacillus caeni TaxID=2574798 RepID=A0A5R9EXF7_9BACL|nr:copper amine oxidase [Pseudalkalibacillus caeni]TLS35962.1 copper amine oxidase [Pseudalkalibacillus caeni]